MGEDDVMTTNEAAAFLKISRGTLMKYVQEGVIPAQKIGWQWRFSRQALLRWLESGQTPKKEQ